MPSRGPIEIISYFGMVPIFRTQLAFKLKKSFFSEFDGGQGGARAPFAHFWCPRLVTPATGRSLEVLPNLKKIFARAIEPKKYEADIASLVFCLRFCTLQVQQSHCCTCPCFLKS